MSYQTSYNRRRHGAYFTGPGKPPMPDVITALTVGKSGGQQPTVHAKDITNQYELYDLESDSSMNYPASTTKLMTLLLMWEYKNTVWNVTEVVTITADDIAQPYGGLTLSMAGLQEGDILNWEDLAYCVCLPSGADACQAAARIIGDLIYVNSGNTGTQGMARFVERMNSRAIELGMLNTTYFDPLGGSQVGGTIRNVINARALSTVCEKCFSFPALRAVAKSTTHSANIVGANARALALTSVMPFFNGPSIGANLFADPTIKAGKTGEWQISGPVNMFSQSIIWQTPSGYEVVLTVLGSESLWSMMNDTRGAMYQMLQDFPYLAVPATTDPLFAQVQLLVGADGSIADESSAHRTLVNTSVTATDGIVSTGGMLVNNANDDLHTADAPELTIGSGDFTAECWYAGAGTQPPSGEFVFFIKTGSGQKEFAINFFSGVFGLFASADGANWTNTNAFSPQGTEGDVFFNGAPRHLAIVKHGSQWSLFINGEKAPGHITVGTVFDGTGDLSVSIPGSAPLGTIDEYRVTYGTARYTDDMVNVVARKFPRS